MTKTINLVQVRRLARELIREFGTDYRNVVLNGNGDEVTGCVNVVSVKDGKRYEVQREQMFTTDDTGADFDSRKLTVENFAKAGYTIEPGCLIGSILIRGELVTIQEILDDGEDQFGTCTASFGWAPFLKVHKIVATEAARTWMGVAQGKQDSGAKWGSAIEYADSVVLSDMLNGNLGFADL